MHWSTSRVQVSPPMFNDCSPDLVHLLVDHASIAVAVFDRQMRYIRANDHHYVAYNLLNEADLTGVAHPALVPEGGERWRDCVRRCVEEQIDCCSGELPAPAPDADGMPRQLYWEMFPWRDVHGRISGVVLFTTVFSNTGGAKTAGQFLEAEEELRRARRELAVARAEALEASRVKSAFLATLSHELRTPLSSILLFCEMLHEDALQDGKDSMIRDLERVIGAGRQLQELINNLLGFARLEAGRMQVEAHPFDLAELVRRVTGDIRPLAEKTGNELHVQMEEPLGVMHSDSMKIRHCLLNLLSNSCKFTEKGNILFSIRRTRSETGDRVVFEVQDTGIGISPEILPRLFREFEPGDMSLTRRHGGLGLGLAMTRRYAELLGGEVSVQNNVGQGAVFTLRLPADVTTLFPYETAPPQEDERAGNGEQES